MKNLGLKSLSLMIAILLAYFVNSESNTSVFSFVVPVEIANLPESKIVLLPSLRQAQVSVRGPSFLVSRIAASPPVFKIEIPPDAGNRFEVALQHDLLALPSALDILSIEPSSMEFVFDNLIKKRVRVDVPQLGGPDAGMQITQILATPAEVELSGPQTEISEVSYVETSPFDVRDLRASERRVLKLRPPGKYSQVDPKEVEVVVGVVSKMSTRLFERLTVEVRAAGGGAYALAPSFLDLLEVSGAQDAVSVLKPEQVVPYVKITSAEEVNKTVKVSVELPEGITIVRLQPDSLKVVQFDGVVVRSPQRTQRAETITLHGDKLKRKN